MANFDQQKLQIVSVQNQLMVGSKGGLAIVAFLDFSGQPQFTLDFENFQSTNKFDLCQTLFVDNADGGSAVTITFPNSRQRIVVKSNSQGYFNVLCSNPIKAVVDCLGGNPVTIFFINVAIPGATWPAV